MLWPTRITARGGPDELRARAMEPQDHGDVHNGGVRPRGATKRNTQVVQQEITRLRAVDVCRAKLP